MKIILKLVLVIIILSGCTNSSDEIAKANVHLYSYQGISVKVILSEENYNEIRRLEITQNETSSIDDPKMTESLETNRQNIEDFVLNVDDSQLVFGDQDPENWIANSFFNVRLSDKVKSTDNDLNVYVVKYIINFKHTTVEKQCCGYKEVINYFGLSNAIEDGKLLFDKFVENNQFLFHEVLIAENGLYVQQKGD